MKTSSFSPARLIALIFATAVPAIALADDPAIQLVKSETTLTLKRGDTPILTYHLAEVPPPAGVDPVFHRSGFIHPLHAPGGGVVTGIHPDDHYHHLGLWHAWVKTEYGEHHPDFWNLKAGTGRVRYAGTEEIRKTGFTVAQEQVAYLDGPEAKPTVILKESLAVDAAFEGDANVIDYTVTQTNVAPKPLVLPAYRYGGPLAYRAPHSWTAENSDYLTSEGLTRKDSHATRARWVAMSGPAEKGDGGDATLAILCHPENHDAPQRIRTWDNGKVFFNYVPIQETGWKIKPGQTVKFRYRLVVSDGKPDAGSIEKQWKAFANSGK